LNGKDAASLSAIQEEGIKRAEIEARLVMVDYFPLDWGYEIIVDAMERKDVVLDFEIPAAGQYMEIVGHRLYVGVVNGEKIWALERLRARDFGRRGKIMSLERWSFWEEQFGDLIQSDATGDIAKAAAVTMKAKIEMDRIRGVLGWHINSLFCSRGVVHHIACQLCYQFHRFMAYYDILISQNIRNILILNMYV
jgi:hypothetical protein